jgi:HSP20 family molecular chaperone IbpA
MYHNDVLRPTFGGQGFSGFGFGMNQTPSFGYGQSWGVPAHGFAPAYGFGYGVNAPAHLAWNTQGYEAGLIQQQMNALTGQIAQLTELVCRTTFGAQQAAPSQVNAFSHPQAGIGFASGRVRESDSHLFWEVAFPGLSMGDLDVEVSGNRVICRTRIPLRNQLRAVGQIELPRGLEIFELPDGRVELNWLVPVTFSGKEVEACWKDGWVQISIPKTEISHRQSVKITAEGTNNGVRKNGARDLTA